MRAIALPYDVDAVGHEVLDAWRRVQSAAVRSAYANAPGRSEGELRDFLKARFPCSPSEPCAIDAWLLHCANREGIKLRNQRPDGKMVFGGRKNLERRQKGLITAGDWRALRQRPLVSAGDKGELGNRHFRLSPNARTCMVRIYATAVTLHLPEMRGKRGVLLRAVSTLAAAGEINVEFRLGAKALSVVFDPADLRRLPANTTLQQDDDARLAAKGHKPRGRPRGANGSPPPFRWADVERPVHPEWGTAIAALPRRCLALDLNPNWIGSRSSRTAATCEAWPRRPCLTIAWCGSTCRRMRRVRSWPRRSQRSPALLSACARPTASGSSPWRKGSSSSAPAAGPSGATICSTAGIGPR